MGDENNGDALGGNVTHGCQEAVCLALGQNGGGLIEDQQLDAGLVDLTGDLHELHVTDGHAGDLLVLAQVQADGVQGLPGVGCHGFLVQLLQGGAEDGAGHGGLGDLTAQLDIFGDGESGDEHEFLVDHANAQLHGLVGRVDGDGFAVELNGALESAGGVDDGHAEQNVHQRGLASAVFAHEGVDLTGSDLELDALEDLGTEVVLGDVVHLQYKFFFHSYSFQ